MNKKKARRRKRDSSGGQSSPLFRWSRQQWSWTPDRLGWFRRGPCLLAKACLAQIQKASCQSLSLLADLKVLSIQRNIQGGSHYRRAEKPDFPLLVPPNSPPRSWATEDCGISMHYHKNKSVFSHPAKLVMFPVGRGEAEGKKARPGTIHSLSEAWDLITSLLTRMTAKINICHRIIWPPLKFIDNVRLSDP